MADDENQRPTLEGALLNKEERGFGGLGGAQAHETDPFLKLFVNALVLDAEVTAAAERLKQGRRAREPQEEAGRGFLREGARAQ